MRLALPMILACFVLGLVASRACAAEDPFVEGEVLVTFKPGIATDTARSALSRHSLRLAKHFDQISRLRQRVAGLVREHDRTTAALITELKADPNVESAEPNYVRRISTNLPDDPDFPKQWALQNTGQSVNGTAGTNGADTGFVAAWNLAKPSSSDVVIGIVDTGVDINHPDLAPNIWTNSAEIPGNGLDDDHDGYVDDLHGYDFARGSPDVADSGDHGTHVAGTVAAAGDNGIGITGVNPRAKILPLKVSTDGNSMVTSAVIAAFNYAIDLKQRGVNVAAVNTSFGGNSWTISEQNAIEALRDAGIILCAAAGNGNLFDIGVNNDFTPVYPANYPVSNIISVAALDQNNTLASFSNYGATTVDIAAPGVNIYSAMPLAAVSPTTTVTVGTDNYAAAEIQYSGTTAATGLTRTIHHCGIGNPGDFPAAVNGNIALIQRGTLTFAAKLTNAMSAGAVAAIVYDNTAGTITTGNWTLGGAGPWIPAVRITNADGLAIIAKLPASGTVGNWRDPANAYQFLDGTSMAAPHVSGAVAFAARNFPADTMPQRIARILGHVTPLPSLTGRCTSGGSLNLTGIVDTDRDGLPDWWETQFFSNLAQGANDDPDRDGATNLAEFQAGTDPANSTSHLVFPVITVEQPAGTTLAAGDSSVHCGAVTTGSAHTPTVFSIHNTGTGDLTNLAVSVVGANAADFVPETSGMPTTVPPGGGTNFTVTFRPSATGARTATLRITSNDTARNPFEITLSGTGLASTPQPAIAIEQPSGHPQLAGSSHDCGDVIVSRKESVTFTIRNTGKANLTNLGIQLTGPNATDFRVTGNLSGSVKPGKTKSFKLSFAPQSAGSKQATLRVTSNAPVDNPYEITLVGTAFERRTGTDKPPAAGATTVSRTSAATLADPDALLRFATGGDALPAAPAPCRVSLRGGRLFLHYPRSTAAVAAGVRFTVEWSDDLAHWQTDDVTESVSAHDPSVGIDQMCAEIPLKGAKTRFIRLRVTSPP